MLEGKVIKAFADKENKMKTYTVGDKFRAETKRYKELESKGCVSEGKEIASKK